MRHKLFRRAFRELLVEPVRSVKGSPCMIAVTLPDAQRLLFS
jgi:hypothetical protein